MGERLIEMSLYIKELEEVTYNTYNISIKKVKMEEMQKYIQLKSNIFDSNTVSCWWLDYIVDDILGNKYFFFYNSDGDLIGLCGIKYRKMKCFLYDFGILPEFRGLGLSKLCLYSVISKLRKEAIEQIDLNVKKDNEKALNLYETLGFIRKGVDINE